MDAQILERFMIANEGAVLVPPDLAGGANSPMLSSVFHRLALVVGSRIGRTTHAAFADLGGDAVAPDALESHLIRPETGALFAPPVAPV